MGYKNPKIGIYAITHVPSGRRYIGQAQDIYSRWTNHRFFLKKGTHSCRYLQNVWNKYPVEEFEFSVLELCTVSRLDARERHWLRVTPKLLRMNLHPVGKTARGWKVSESTKQVLSEAHKIISRRAGESVIRSKRANNQHRQGKFGRSTWSEETKERFLKNLRNRPKPKLHPEAVSKILKLAASGVAQRKIARVIDVCQTSVVNVLRRHGMFGRLRTERAKYERARLGDGHLKRRYPGV